MLKPFVLLNILVENVIVFFQDSLMDIKYLFEIEICYSIINVFTVTLEYLSVLSGT